MSRFFSDDVDQLKIVTERMDGDHYYLRQSNLEDVFLKATGRQLNAQQ
jgi:hypothetical protein